MAKRKKKKKTLEIVIQKITAFISDTFLLTQPTRKRRKRKQSLPPFIKNKKAAELKLAAKKALISFLVFIMGAVFLIVSTFFFYYQFLPTPAIANLKNIEAKGATIYDRNGVILYNLENGSDHKKIDIDEVSPYLIKATIAAEDANFYDHNGFDLKGIARAAWVTTTKDNIQGGSTITQQVVKNTVVGNKQNLNRKLKELALAIKLDKEYTKNEILEVYINNVFYGNNSWGIWEASRHYFKKEPKDLSLAEASMLAGLPVAPSYYSPLVNFNEAKKRQAYTLERMVALKYISEEEAQAAKNTQLNLNAHQNEIKAPHFVMHVISILADQYGKDEILENGFKVYTTLDWEKQKIAQEAVSSQVEKLKSQNVSSGALVSMNPKNGDVLAYVGSPNWHDDQALGKVDNAQALNQPGSSIKPFIYLKAFQEGMTAATILKDKPTDFGGGYKPKNYDGKYRGDVTPRKALALSLNVPAVQTMQKVGLNSTLDTLNLLGIDSLKDPNRYGLSLVLGGGEVKLVEMVSAYGSLANGGYNVEPNYIQKIEDMGGNSVYTKEDIPPKRIIDEAYPFIISSFLSDNDARAEVFGTRSPLLLSRPAAAKTGTTDDYRDSWTLGYTPDLVTGVWIGNPNNERMHKIAGSLGAAPIWNDFMEDALKDSLPLMFIKPDNVVEVDSNTGVRNASAGGTKVEYFVKGTEPPPTPTPRPKNNDSKKIEPREVKRYYYYYYSLAD